MNRKMLLLAFANTLFVGGSYAVVPPAGAMPTSSTGVQSIGTAQAASVQGAADTRLARSAVELLRKASGQLHSDANFVKAKSNVTDAIAKVNQLKPAGSKAGSVIKQLVDLLNTAVTKLGEAITLETKIKNDTRAGVNRATIKANKETLDQLRRTIREDMIDPARNRLEGNYNL